MYRPAGDRIPSAYDYASQKLVLERAGVQTLGQLEEATSRGVQPPECGLTLFSYAMRRAKVAAVFTVGGRPISVACDARKYRT